MRFKFLVLLIANVILASSYPAGAQQPGKIPRIGFVVGSGDAKNPGLQVEGFQKGLRDLGYADGKNLVIEYRYAEGNNERFPSLVSELVQLKVDVLFVSALPAILAAKKTTKTIPIVMMINTDPVAAGIVDSLARPGGNITGLTRLSRELGGKRLELLKEAVPRTTRVGVLWRTNSVGLDVAFKEYEVAARALKMQLRSLTVQGLNPDIDGALNSAVNEKTHALIVISDVLLGRYAKQIADLAIKHRLPSMHEQDRYVDAGGLISYGADDLVLFRRAATYVDKILKGTKPADLPVEQPTKFEFVINLKTAKALNLTIPQSVLFRADKVIR
jgi:putative tryptophan/tyrosine transport system substrate-binding protein